MTTLTRTAELCLTERRGELCPNLALDGLRLCWCHRRDLERLIAELPARHDDLTRPLGAPSTTRGTSAPGLSVDEAAADLRHEMTALLASWCSVVVDTRGVTAPASEEIWRTAPWLTVHVEWCAAQEFAGDMLAELRGVTGRSYGIADIPARYLDLGDQCLTHEDGERCTGVVTLVVRGDDWAARCPVCETVQEATPYLRTAQRGEWVTAEDVIRLAGVFGIACSIDVIYQWKRRKRIVGRPGPLGGLYDLGSVQRYLVRRQTEQRRISA